MNFGSGECIESSECIEAVLEHVMSGDFILKKSVHACMESVLYPAKNKEIYGIVSYQNFPCHFARKTSACGS